MRCCCVFLPSLHSPDGVPSSPTSHFPAADATIEHQPSLASHSKASTATFHTPARRESQFGRGRALWRDGTSPTAADPDARRTSTPSQISPVPWRLGYVNKPTVPKPDADAEADADARGGTRSDDEVEEDDWRPGFQANPNPASWPVSLLHAHAATAEVQHAFATVGRVGHSTAKTKGRPAWRPSNAPASTKDPMRGTSEDATRAMSRSSSAPLGARRASTSPAPMDVSTTPLEQPSSASSPPPELPDGELPYGRHMQRRSQGRGRSRRRSSQWDSTDAKPSVSRRGSTLPASVAESATLKAPLPGLAARRRSTASALVGDEAFTQPTQSHVEQCLLHASRNRSCAQCMARSKRRSLLAVTQHAAPLTKVAGACKPQQQMRQSALRGGTLRFSKELNKAQVAAMLAERSSEEDRRREMRRPALQAFVQHQLFYRLNFSQLRQAGRDVAVAAATGAPMPARGLGRRGGSVVSLAQTQAPVHSQSHCGLTVSSSAGSYLSRDHFLRAFHAMGYSSRNDVSMLHKLFSAFDVYVKDLVPFSTMCRRMQEYQADTREALGPRGHMLRRLSSASLNMATNKARFEQLMLEMFK